MARRPGANVGVLVLNGHPLRSVLKQNQKDNRCAMFFLFGDGVRGLEPSKASSRKCVIGGGGG